MRVGILTGGGDAPGLNAVIYGALLKAFDAKDIEVVGIKKGWKAFDIPKEQITPDVVARFTEVLKIGDLDDLHTKGGTILYSTRTNPFKAVAKCKTEEEKDAVRKKVGEDLASKMALFGLDALIAVGGDDTCGVAAAMYKYSKANVVACPKTIDNDLAGTDYTFGFFSAAQAAMVSLENLTTTAHSHQRIFVVEVMGRDAGWLTLFSGLGSGADIILLPETPFDFNRHVIEQLKKRVKAGYKYHMIACSEGAYPTKESLDRDFKTINQKTIDDLPKDAFGNPKLNHLNMASVIEKELSKCKELAEICEKADVEFEVRSAVLGHTMRSGHPNVFDRVLGLRFGWHAMNYVINKNWGKMTSLAGTEIVPVDIVKGAGKKYIDPKSDLVEIAHTMTSVEHKSKEKLFM
jgi:6-phosphofructokinase 1